MSKALTGRNRRLQYEWKKMEQHLSPRTDISLEVLRKNAEGLPESYLITYHLLSICSVADYLAADQPKGEPVFANEFKMQIDLPDNYPCIDGLPYFHFLTHTPDGQAIPHPWHPNIRFFGECAGRVCLNMPDTYTDLVWGVERVAHYLRYDLYHAKNEPPYPEDLRVAKWVVAQGEPNGWIYFEQPHQ